MSKSNDTHIMYIEDDMKKIQTKTNLYLQKFGDLGVFHLFKEAAQNSIDEGVDPSCWDYLKQIGEGKKKYVVKVTYDRLSDKVTVEDTGRGIPETDYPIDIVCTKLQAGSKFFRDQGGASSGEFGVGITLVNALSTYFTLATYRGDYYHEIEFKDGEKTNDVREKTSKTGKKHGTITSFIANPFYLGAGSHLPMDKVREWLELMSYLIMYDIEFQVEEWEGLTCISKEKYKKKDFAELINHYISDPKALIFQPVSMTSKRTITEEIKKNIVDDKGVVKAKKEKMKKSVTLQFGFAYDQSMEVDERSFCNFTQTDDGGIHIEGVEDVLCRFLQQQTRDSLSDTQKEKMQILYQDVKAGLKLVVNLSTNAQVDFMGNAKSRIQNENLKPVLKEMALEEITKYFEKEPGKLKALTGIIKANAKARIDLQKAKSINVSKKIDTFGEYELSNFIKCNNTGNKYKEIFLIEGRKSAAGSMINGRDPYTQAIFGFRGVTANAFKKSLSEIMGANGNSEWKQYVRVLHTGIGANFDIRRLYYNKIIISTDADIDGDGIAVGIAGFHVRYMPEIIEAGHLYRVYPPLYRIADTTNPFVGSKIELAKLCMKKIVKNYNIRMNLRGSDYFDDDALWKYLYATIDYLNDINELYNFYKIDRGLLEAVFAGITIFKAVSDIQIELPGTRIMAYQLYKDKLNDQKFIRDFMSFIQKRYPEIRLENGVIKGVVNGAVVRLSIDQRFVTRLSSIIPVIREYGYDLFVKEKGAEERKLTNMEFLDNTSKLRPKIISRFKGLGEADADQLWETTLNPEKRSLVQLTFGDIERDIEIFNKLKSDKPKYQAQRKAMFEGYRIRRDDIDN